MQLADEFSVAHHVDEVHLWQAGMMSGCCHLHLLVVVGHLGLLLYANRLTALMRMVSCELQMSC